MGDRQQGRDCGGEVGLAEYETRLKTSCKILWGLQQQEKLPVSQESLLERPTGSKTVYKPTHL